MAAIEATDVRKAYGETVVLDGVDLSVADDEILVLMGPNGAGKTTFLSCLAGSDAPTDGTIRAFGQPPAATDGEISLLLQETATIDTLTGRENIEFYSKTYPRFTDRWEEYVDMLGIRDALDRSVGDYSGGMKRKLELAIVLSTEAELYFLDEPTAGIDLSAVGKVHRAILDLHERGKAVLLASHRPLDFDIADRIAFLGDGRIQASGEPMALLDGLPTTVRLPGVRSAEAATDHLLASYYVGSEVRGFVDGASTRDDVAGTVAATVDDAHGDRVVVVEPGFADAFNYYVAAETGGD